MQLLGTKKSARRAHDSPGSVLPNSGSQDPETSPACAGARGVAATRASAARTMVRLTMGCMVGVAQGCKWRLAELERIAPLWWGARSPSDAGGGRHIAMGRVT